MNLKGVKRIALLQHHPLSIPEGRKQEVMSQESDLGWQIHLYHGKNYEMTSSLIVWDLSPAVVNKDWFTSQAAFLDSKTWFKNAILMCWRKDLKVPWIYVAPLCKVTQQRVSPDSANLTSSPSDLNKSYLGKISLILGSLKWRITHRWRPVLQAPKTPAHFMLCHM